jgi:DNA-binding XRE family transcriptional regulator
MYYYMALSMRRRQARPAHELPEASAGVDPVQPAGTLCVARQADRTKPVHPTFGRKLRWFRELRGLTQKELGAKVGQGRDWIAKLEGAKENPSYPTAVELAAILNVSVSWLLDYSDPPPSPLPPQ